jgi:nucleobase:cation symporter-1, NCS1 family
MNAYLNGTPGAKHHLGYGMLARARFGLWGSYFCVMLNVFQSFVFYVRWKYKNREVTANHCAGDTNVLWWSGFCNSTQFHLPNFPTNEEHAPGKVRRHKISNCHTSTHRFCSAGITTPGLIGFVLFMVLYFPIIYFIPAYKIQKLLEVQVIVATATLLGIMAWAVHVSFILMFAIGFDSDFITGERWRPW